MARNPPDFDTAFQIALGFEADCVPQRKKYYEHLKNHMQLRTFTNALARTVCVIFYTYDYNRILHVQSS